MKTISSVALDAEVFKSWRAANPDANLSGRVERLLRLELGLESAIATGELPMLACISCGCELSPILASKNEGACPSCGNNGWKVVK
jgi:hypothetical protein